jgi:nitronate monooxygenase
MESITKLLQLKYPIVQAPMLGVTTPEMVASISNAGGLGSLPVGGLSPERTIELIRATKDKTDSAFAVNLFAHDLKVEIAEEDIRKMEDFLEPLYLKFGLQFTRKALSEYKFYNHRDQIQILLDEQVPIVSFTFGFLESDIIKRLKGKGIKVIGTATSVKEALLLEQSLVDAVVAQGYEAGGHRGSFVDDNPSQQVGLFSLVPQIADEISVPIIAAGGIFDHRTMNAAFALGASGVQLGSYFIAADESAATEVYKDQLLSASDTSTELTNAFTGRWARGIRNDFMLQMENSGLKIPYYTYQNSLTTALREHGKKNNLADVISLWAGQSASKTHRGSCQQLFQELIDNFEVPAMEK